MPRKATKDTNASAPRSSSKRPAQEVSQRQTKRARAAARKSYVEPDTDTDDAEQGLARDISSKKDEDDDAASEYEDPDKKEPSTEPEPDETASDDDDDDNGGRKQRKPRGRPAKSLPIHKKDSDERELWKPGAKLEPGTKLVIKKPKARDAGDTPYLDHTIHPNTLLFLKELAANNDRNWLKRTCLSAFSDTSHAVENHVQRSANHHVVHDPDFRVAFQDFTTFAEKVSEKVIEADETIPELPVKDVVSAHNRRPQ